MVLTRERLSTALLLTACALAAALVSLFDGEGRCAISPTEAIPMILEQRTGCPGWLP